MKRKNQKREVLVTKHYIGRGKLKSATNLFMAVRVMIICVRLLIQERVKPLCFAHVSLAFDFSISAISLRHLVTIRAEEMGR
jgi:hypothetical protein